MASGLNRVSVSEVPEVKALETFDAMHREELERLGEVQAERDILEQSADKAVRARGVSCGAFTRISETDQINWEKLYETVGRESFMDTVGGVITTVSKYSGDKDLYKQAVIRGIVNPITAKAVHKVVARYKVSK